MKISYHWLKDYLNFTQSADELSDILTNLGLEVEGIAEWENIKGGLKGLVVGQVLECSKHENADKLSVAKVNIGMERPLDIVCGAPNVTVNQKVIVAPVGTILNHGNEKFEIKKAKIRGALSEGMICAEDEIGLGDSHEGIIVLDDKASIGAPVSNYFEVISDTVFEIGLTPNRIDGASHFGAARDIYAFLNYKGHDVSLSKPDVSGYSTTNIQKKIDVEIENPELCPRYSGLYISNVEIKESPQWLKNKLKSIGLNPINNVVDITNFILHEIGQPMHAFDAKRIRGGKIIVKTLPEAFDFTTLDEDSHQMTDADLMICDADGPVAIAGVMGGLNSEITNETKDIFLESAYFNPSTVRRTSKRLQLNTDSSFRFERGTDPENTVWALKRAASLIQETGGGEISAAIIDVYPNKLKPIELELKFFNLNRLVGQKIEKSVIRTILTALDILILEENDEGMKLQIPLYRVDVTREADVIEEILRVYGYNEVTFSSSIVSSLAHSLKPDKDKILNIVADLLVNNGFREIMSNSLTNSAYYQDLKSYKKEALVQLLNSISTELDVMRQTLLFGGLEALIHNINRKRNNLKLFEFGNCYQLINQVTKENPLDKYSEKERLALFITGNKEEEHWSEKQRQSSVFDVKHFTDLILNRLGLPLADINIDQTQNDIFDEGIRYSLKEKELVQLGEIKKKILSQFDIPSKVFYAEFDWNNILALIRKDEVSVSALPKYPEVRRDLALLIDKSVTFKQIKDIAFKTEKSLLKEIKLFDIYEDERLSPGKKSYAISFILQDENQTLKDKQIEKTMDKLMKTFEREVDAQIR